MTRALRWLLDAWGRRPAWLRWLAVIAAAGLVWWSSSQEQVPRAPSWSRAFLHNGAHVVAFGGIGGLVLLALRGLGAPGRGRCVAAVATAAAYGLVDELHQAQVPGRVCSVGDWLTDCCGAWLACAVVVAVRGAAPRANVQVATAAVAAVAATCAATWLPI